MLISVSVVRSAIRHLLVDMITDGVNLAKTIELEIHSVKTVMLKAEQLPLLKSITSSQLAKILAND
jgi:hypothetical protein